jgi:DNA-binding FrmR family transcriptional regulator
LSHTVQDKTKLLARVRRLRGQVDAIERALVADAECGEVMHLVAAVRGAIGGLSHELIEDHLRSHVLDVEVDEVARERAAAELLSVLRTYVK